jgi:hypothetical protein
MKCSYFTGTSENVFPDEYMSEVIIELSSKEKKEQLSRNLCSARGLGWTII